MLTAPKLIKEFNALKIGVHSIDDFSYMEATEDYRQANHGQIRLLLDVAGLDYEHLSKMFFFLRKYKPSISSHESRRIQLTFNANHVVEEPEFDLKSSRVRKF